MTSVTSPASQGNAAASTAALPTPIKGCGKNPNQANAAASPVKAWGRSKNLEKAPATIASTQEPPATIYAPPDHVWSAAAVADLDRSDISPEQAEALGMFSLENASEIYPEFRAEPALVLPYYNPDHSPKMFERDGQRLHFCRVRYLNPPIDPFTGKQKDKYGQPARSGVHIYWPRTTDWAKVLPDLDKAVIIGEGEKTTARISLEPGCFVIGIGGCWNWRQEGGLKGTRQVLPELEPFIVPGREVILALDGDAAINKLVARAQGLLALEFGTRRGADVYRLRFPFDSEGSRMAADDVFKKLGRDVFWDIVEAAEKMCEADARVAELNENYAVVAVNGVTRVARFGYDNVLCRQNIEYFREQDFKLMLADQTVASPADPRKRMPLAKAWLEHPHRRAYPNGIAFAPGDQVPESTLNLWHGFSVEPAPGDWSLFHDHLLYNICGGDRECFEYFLSWLARMVQRPWEVGQVGIVLRGKKGTGKSKVGWWVGQLMRDHFFHAIQSAHVTGQFNSHLINTKFLFADEALFAGDPKAENILKGLITEETRTSEQKFMPAITVPNFLNVMIATNSTWAITATEDERRWLVLDVSDGHMQDHAYFAAIDRQMKAGGLAALLHDLLARNISKFEVRRFPRTAALAEQQIQTLHGRGTVAGWVYDFLSAGEIRDDRDSQPAYVWSQDGLEISKNDARRIFDDWAKRHGRRPIDPGLFGREMRSSLGAAFRETRRRTNAGRSENYVFEPLLECRQAYRIKMAMPDLWSDGDE